MNNSNKIIYDLCGGTGAWSGPYKKAGYDVRIITLPKYDIKNFTINDNPYGILAAPPCSQFSFIRTTPKNPRDLEWGMELVYACLKIIWECQYKTSEHSRKGALKFWALENSNGMLKYFLGNPPYSFHPYEHGNPYKKRTNIWGYFNEPQKNVVKPLDIKYGKVNNSVLEQIHGKIPREYTIPDGQRKDKTLRSITPSGFAQAFFEANP